MGSAGAVATVKTPRGVLRVLEFFLALIGLIGMSFALYAAVCFVAVLLTFL